MTVSVWLYITNYRTISSIELVSGGTVLCGGGGLSCPVPCVLNRYVEIDLSVHDMFLE